MSLRLFVTLFNLWDDAADGDRSSVAPSPSIPSHPQQRDDDDEHSINTAKDKFHSIASTPLWLHVQMTSVGGAQELPDCMDKRY